MEKCLNWRNVIHILAIALSVLSLCMLLIACKNSNPDQTKTPTKTIQPTQPTLKPIQTNIPANPGWQEVLHLGNEKNPIAIGGVFASTRSYQIFALCEGNGSLKISFSPQGSSTFTCQTNPQLQVVVIENPPKPEQISVYVTPPQGDVLWVASVQMRK